MGYPAEIQELDYIFDQQAVGCPTEIQALGYPPDQQAVGRPTEIQALGDPPISKQYVISRRGLMKRGDGGINYQEHIHIGVGPWQSIVIQING